VIGKSGWFARARPLLGLLALAACTASSNHTKPSEDEADGDAVPCDVAAVVSEHCAECHGSPLAYGAPMPLLSLSDFQAASLSPRKKVHALIPDRLEPADTNRRMPPTSKPALSASERATLRDWATDGARGAAKGCAIEAPPEASEEEGPFDEAGSGGAHIRPIAYDDPELECYKLVAFANGDKSKKYTVPAGATDSYIQFYYKVPWEGVRYTRSIKIITGNKAVIHHWLLFNNQSPGKDGTAAPGLGTHAADEELLYGWAPGASPLYLDPDVGQKLESGSGFTLEAHYNNTGGDADDASGAELCVTKAVPEHEAGLSWVGTDLISGVSASGTCDPKDQEIHLIVAQPHMHKTGKHMKVVINRKDGSQETIHDEDFSFESQRYYPLNIVMQSGDTMTTTCDYSALATFGRGTNQEMCYFFTLHWPAGALTAFGLGSLIHGGYSCL
jgi:Copper type II ascorbate-dependent monooxygenase, C-terminal domain